MRTCLPRLTAVIALLTAALVASVHAQPAAPVPPVKETVVKEAPVVPEVSVKVDEAAHPGAAKTKDAAGKDTLSVDFPDEDIRSILRNVADLFELNIIIPEGLQGKASIKLRDVTWRQIFTSVLQPVNYNYVEDGNIIKVVSNESLQLEPVATEVFILNYARASDVKPSIDTLVDGAAGGKSIVDARSNSLIITERPTRMNRIRPIIEKLDRATDQVMIETKFIEVNDGDVKNIGVNWASIQNYSVGVKGTGDSKRTRGQTGSDGVADRNESSSGSTSGQTNASTNSNTVTSTNGTPSAVSTTGSTGGLTNAVTGALTNTVNNLTSLVNNDGTSRTLSAVFSADEFKLVLSALQTQQTTKIVSNPTVVTLNNTEAVINVGQERPIPKYAYNEQRGGFEVNGFDYKPIGVILRVTPQVNSRGFIKLTVEPEVSQSTRDAVFNGSSIPIIETRKAKTQVSLKDGSTMGIGGLMNSSVTKSESRVPVLGSIPGLGRLFRTNSSNIETTNLLIFITAKSISPDGASVEQIYDSSRLRELKLHRSELPGYRDGSDPFVVEEPLGPDGKPLSASKKSTKAKK